MLYWFLYSCLRVLLDVADGGQLLPKTPEVRVTLRVPKGSFSAPTRVEPLRDIPGTGGGMERYGAGWSGQNSGANCRRLGVWPLTGNQPRGFAERKAQVFVSDPWEFMTEVGEEPLVGTITEFKEADERVAEIVVALDRPVTFQGAKIDTVAASPRHEGAPSVTAAFEGVSMPANIEASDSDKPASRPVGLVGDIRIMP
jgi:hypothetical protein